MNRFSILLTCYIFINVQSTGLAFAEKCYTAKAGFAVAQPYMVTKSCLLFQHGANIDLENQSEMVEAREGEYDPDPLHSEFIRFVIERKLIPLKKGTPLFSCEYDLTTLAKDFKFWGSRDNKTLILGYELPEFNCNATISMWAPVRPVNESHCFWVAVPLIRCDEIGSELAPLSVTDQETDEE